MTRIHDMGGRFGDGPVNMSSEQEPVFELCWHARALALTLAAGTLGRWNIDAARHARECLPPGDYTRFSYYEKWLAALANLLVERRLVTPEEFATPELSPPAPLHQRALKSGCVDEVMSRGASTLRELPVRARFAVDERVHTRGRTCNRIVNGGHHRLPSYAQGRTGTIARVHGAHVLPDSNAHFLGEAPEPLYSVRFSAGELWASDSEHRGDEMFLDVWESHLEPV